MSDSTAARTPSNWNQQVIDEFRSKQGKVGGPFESVPLLLLHHFGAKSGVERINPLAYQAISNGYAIFGSKGGAQTNPDWYHNLRAHPDVTVEVGTETFTVRARVAEGEERDTIWERQKADFPNFADYEARTVRSIPVVLLEHTRAS